MPRIKKSTVPTTSASEIYANIDGQILTGATRRVLEQGGAMMFGQTRDNAKLIITVYLDGDQDKEYCDDVEDATTFLAQYQV